MLGIHISYMIPIQVSLLEISYTQAGVTDTYIAYTHTYILIVICDRQNPTDKRKTKMQRKTYFP